MNTRITSTGRRAALLVEAAVAMGLLGLVLLPMAFAFVHESKLCRAYYFKAVALEIVDGEMEALTAGEWKAFAQGRQAYPVRAAAATNLPPGEFALTLDGRRARLEWIPKARHAGGSVAREAEVR